MVDGSEGTPDAESFAKAEQAKKALLERPRVSIRTRLMVASAAWFLLTLGLAIAAILSGDPLMRGQVVLKIYHSVLPRVFFF